MAVTDLATRVEELLEPEATKHGFELVAVEQAGGKGTPVIRVLLDRDEGIDIDALASANRWICELLDESDPIPGHYTLEVSSPGVDRPLRRIDDYQRFSGENATIKARTTEGRGAWTGQLLGVEGTDVLLEVDGSTVRIAFDDITRARLKGEVDFGSREER